MSEIPSLVQSCRSLHSFYTAIHVSPIVTLAASCIVPSSSVLTCVCLLKQPVSVGSPFLLLRPGDGPTSSSSFRRPPFAHLSSDISGSPIDLRAHQQQDRPLVAPVLLSVNPSITSSCSV